MEAKQLPGIRCISVAEFHAELDAQGVPAQEHLAFRCPMCGTIQSPHDLIQAGAGKTFDEVERFVGFSCVGRFTGAGTPRNKPDGKPCDWSLGGFFRLHKLEVETPDGKRHPRFEPASPEEAQAHATRA